MKQQELEQFIGQLADAERAAAAKISEAEQAAEARIEARREALEGELRQQLEALAESFAEQRQTCIAALRDEAKRREAATTARIATLEQYHEASREALLRWLFEEVTRP